MYQFTLTCERLQKTRSGETANFQSTLSTEDFRAKTLVRQVNNLVLSIATNKLHEAGSGGKCFVSFAKLDQSGLWLKTYSGCCQQLLIPYRGGQLELFSETWPAWGIVLDGVAMEQTSLEPFITESESGLLPTPLASDSIAWEKVNKHNIALSIWKGIKRSSQVRTIYLLMLERLSPIQSAEFYEMMMGYPKGWTDLKLSATQLSHNNFTQFLKQ